MIGPSDRTAHLFQVLVENMTEPTFVLDDRGRIVHQSPSLGRALGASAQELSGTSLFDFMHPRDRSTAVSAFAELVADHGGSARFEAEFVHSDGSRRLLEIRGRNLLDEDAVRGLLVNARDITARRTTEERLLHAAMYDQMTGLVNQTVLLDRLAKHRSSPEVESCTVLLVDVDRLQLVNDNLGRRWGDELLIRLAQRLESCFRPGDTLARVGGDEFGVLLPGSDETTTGPIVARIREALKAPFTLDGQDTYCTVSVGVTVSDDKSSSPDALLRDATVAVGCAKDLGGDGHAVFDVAMRSAVDGRLKLEAEVRRAIERNELVVHYQPIVEVETRAIRSFEALVRWEHPERGLLGPGAFLPVAEETGLITEIGWWMLDRVCAQVATWRAAGLDPVPVHVNVSASQVMSGELNERVRAALETHGCSGDHLSLELTESTLMNRADESARWLKSLRDIGVGLSIDDFGTGYSSLSYLHQFPADVLKIDRAFVSRMGPNGEHTQLVRTIVRLGHDLGMSVVAEGIEEEHELALLQEMGCDYGQGYLFSPPVPADQARSFIDQPRPSTSHPHDAAWASDPEEKEDPEAQPRVHSVGA